MEVSDSLGDVIRKVNFFIIYRVFQEFDCKQLRFPDYPLFNSTHYNKKIHSSKKLGQKVPANPEIFIVSSGKG